MASDYDRKEVRKMMDECSKVDRVELIKDQEKTKEGVEDLRNMSYALGGTQGSPMSRRD